ncbi:MAG: S8 family serine peptidase [Microvirga sp.]
MQTKGSLVQVVRLGLPRGMSLAQAQRAVRVVDVAATTDLDHFYYTDEGPACTGPGCEAAALVGWNPPAADQCGVIPVIGLIDTGIDLEHGALKGQPIEVLPRLQSSRKPSQRDHGTAVAALLIGRSDSSTPGLLPGGRVLAVDAFYQDGATADRTDVTSLVLALEALAERKVRVVNMSLSGPPNVVLKAAIEAAQAKGIVIVAAAGNNGAGAEPSYPAAYPGVIAVTAVDRQRSVYRRATRGDYVDVAAPGVDLLVAASGQASVVKSGTSYAVPFVSAGAAILRASYPSLDVVNVRARLEASTADLGEPGRDPTYGHGLIQMAGLCSSPREEQPVAQSTWNRALGPLDPP